MLEPEILCARCSETLERGTGSFQLVVVHWICDPSPPEVQDSLSAEETRQEIQRLYRLLDNVSEFEAREEVTGRRYAYLCNTCHKRWLENMFDL